MTLAQSGMESRSEHYRAARAKMGDNLTEDAWLEFYSTVMQGLASRNVCLRTTAAYLWRDLGRPPPRLRLETVLGPATAAAAEDRRWWNGEDEDRSNRSTEKLAATTPEKD